MAVIESCPSPGVFPFAPGALKALLVVRDHASIDRFSSMDPRVAVLPSHSASDALTLLRVERPDVIACELDLPDCPGLHLIRRVRQRSRLEGGATPAIALTTAVSQHTHTRALLAGYQALVSLDTGPTALERAILDLVGGRVTTSRW